MSHSANFVDLFRCTGYFIGKILKGAKLADLPIEQPIKFEHVVNLKTTVHSASPLQSRFCCAPMR